MPCVLVFRALASSFSGDAEILVFAFTMNHARLPFRQEDSSMLRQKSAALFANRVCLLLFAASAAISVWWGADAVIGNVGWTK